MDQGQIVEAGTDDEFWQQKGRGCRRRKRWAMRGPNLTNVILKCTGTRQTIKILQVKYLNNILEQDHRFIKRITGPMMGFKAFHSACATITGIETAT
jgi:transposase-like protein